MNGQTSTLVELAKLLKDLVTENKWAIVICISIIILRHGIVEFIKKLINLGFSWGDVSVQATTSPIPEELQLKEIVETERPGTKEEPPSKTEEIQESWFPKLLEAFKAKQIKEAEEIFEDHLKTVEDTLERVRDKSGYLYFSYILGGEKSSLGLLEKQFAETNNPEEKGIIGFWLAYSYRDVKNYTAEKRVWESLLILDIPEQKVAKFAVALATCLEKKQNVGEARTLIERKIKALSDADALSILLIKLASMEVKHGDKLLAAAAYEKALEYKPDDEGILFDAAYAQGNTEHLPYLSYFNYKTLIRLFPNSDMAINNIGYTSSQLDMPGKSVQYYKEAIDKGNTLAMANLAKVYLSKGFYNEAKELLQKALGQEKPDRAVFEIRTELEKKEKQEGEYNERVLEKAIQQRDFVRLYSDARFLTEEDSSGFSGKWHTESGQQIDLSFVGDKLIGSWKEQGGLLSTKERTFRIVASVMYRSAEGRYTAEAVYTQNILAYTPEQNRNFIAYLTSDGLEIHLMFLDKVDHMFMVFSRNP